MLTRDQIDKIREKKRQQKLAKQKKEMERKKKLMNNESAIGSYLSDVED